jgi:hypothetical protein
MVSLEQVVRGQRLAAVILRVEDSEGFVDIVSHYANQLALLADEGDQAVSFVIWKAFNPAAKYVPHTSHWVVSAFGRPADTTPLQA